MNTPNGIEALENCGWRITEVVGSQCNGVADFIIEQAVFCPLGDVLCGKSLKQVIEHIVKLVTPAQFSHVTKNGDYRIYKFKSAYEQEDFAELFGGYEMVFKSADDKWMVSL